MKKSLLWVMTAILAISGTVTTLTSCASNDDNAVVTPSGPGPLAEKIEGLWWADRNVKGKFAENEYARTADKTYVKIIHAYNFQANGNAQWMKLYINEKGQLVNIVGTLFDDTRVVYPDGSHDTPWFSYTSAEDGTITMTNNNYDVRPDIPQTWQVKYQNETISVADNGIDFKLQPADEQMTEVLNAYNTIGYSGGNGPDGDDEVAESLRDVKYEITRDTAVWVFSNVSTVINAFNRTHEIEAELERMRDESARPLSVETEGGTRRGATIRSAEDPKVAWKPSGIRYVDYTYESVDEQGNPVTLSSRVCWGVTMLYESIYFEFRPCDLVLCAHSTVTSDAEAPTKDGSLETLMLQGDRVLVLPDYIGYGATKDRVHPYINHNLCARNCIDALRAGYKVFKDKCAKDLHPDWKFYVIGASQGGGNALAIHKWLDTHEDFAKLWRFEYSYCAAGPYSPRVTFEEYFKQKILVYPCVLPLTLKAMFAAYPDIMGKWKEEDFYSEAYLKGKVDIDNMIASKEYESTTLNAQICKLFPHPNDPDIVDGKQVYLEEILAPDVCDPTSEKSIALFQCLDRNDLTKGWTPTHPIHLYHGKDDTYVSYANSEAVMEAFPEMATLEEPAKVFADHLATCILWMLSVTFGVW